MARVAWVQLSYLGAAEMEEALGVGVRLGRIDGDTPAIGENDVARIRLVLGELWAHCCDDTLLVTHGDILGQWIQWSTGETVLEADYCSWSMSSRGDGDETASRPPHLRPETAVPKASWGVMAMSIS